MKKGKEDNHKKGSIGLLILRIAPLRRWLFARRDTAEYLRMMEPRTRPEEGMEKLWEGRMGICAVLLIAACVIGVFCLKEESVDGILRQGNRLMRPEREEEISLIVSGESEAGSWQKTMTFPISDRLFTEEECETLNRRVQQEAGQKFLGRNENADHITEKLNFITAISGTQVTLDWTFEDRYIRDDGSIRASRIPPEGVDTEVMVEAKWKNYKGVYHYPVHIDGREESPITAAQKQARRSIRRSIRDQATEQEVTLPEQYRYEEEEKGKNILPVILIFCLLPVTPIIWREQQKRGISAREEQMMVDHPGFVNKVMLLLGAGLTLRFTIERMAGEYERELKEGGDKHYVYEELCVTMQEIRDGVSETQAIENFGKRCRSMPYMRFASVITQNIRKGAEGILLILEKEATDSLVERKQTALRRGEIAGTKLLFPMILMLGLVMAIIMVPAFMSM